MKKIFLIAFSLNLLSGCFAQNIIDKEKDECVPKSISFISNDKIEHSIVMMSCETCVPITNIGYRVVVKMSEDELKAIKTISSECWIRLLENPKTDWAANLILYDIKDRDALLLSTDDKKERWVNFLKKNDIEYWKKELH